MTGVPVLLAVLLFSSCEGLMVARDADGQSARFVGRIGAIIDLSSPDGSLQKLAMELALEDYTRSNANVLTLHVRDFKGIPTQAAHQARRLINDQRVQSIFGLQTWIEIAAVADIGNKAQVPMFSLYNANPSWATGRWPFLLRAARSQTTQLKAISAIISSWQWRRVAIIYEDTEYIGSSTLPKLIEAIREANSDVEYQLGISPFSSMSSRVFVVYTSLPLAVRLFAEAQRKGMMEKGYAWITTDLVCDTLDSVNSSVIRSMQGILCLKNYFPPTDKLAHFSERLQRRFKHEYPEETPLHSSVLGLQIYDAVWAVAEAMDRTEPKGDYSSYFQEERNDSGENEPTLVFSKGHQLLGSLLTADFSGLSGKVKFSGGMLAPSQSFEVINIVGRSYREIGYWTDDLGFSKDLSSGSNYSSSMSTLGDIFWPGGFSVAPRGWAPSVGKMPLRIGVSAISAFPEYVRADHDSKRNKTVISGFSIDIFKEVVEYLPYSLTYDLVAYYGSYDSLVERVPMKIFDAVVGDISILSYRCELVQFTQPYTQSGYVMVVPLRPGNPNKAWIFVKPFSSSLWISIAAMLLVNSLVVWLIERGRERDQGRPRQLSVSIWLSFASLFVHGENVHSNLSRVIVVVWLFVGLVLTSNYTATLSSMLTVQRLEPSVTDINLLKGSGTAIGCNRGGNIINFIKQHLGFPMSSIRQFATMDEYVQAFRSGEIKAAIFAMGHAKMFLAKYCKEFTTAGPTYHAGGFGFIFPKGSPLLPDVSEALLKVFESGKMKQLEDGVVSSYNCSSSSTLGSENNRLGPDNFWGLFVVMEMTCVVVLLLYSYSQADWGNRASLMLISASLKWLREAPLRLYIAAASLRWRVRSVSKAAGGTMTAEDATDLEMATSQMITEGLIIQKFT
ncbi:unnamed protein product [Spirodela intermedia]|uniref:Glutamate receptor n=1 Tax=Spirodela intermedia TaxID=51605 RepID=A0A7I8J6E8_SPIIN|nr:unnamed protein product [Spirodela intermedia]CAA6665806.1 unnamed protein product [Spirodela intermedia]